jgi:hypothetical protein
MPFFTSSSEMQINGGNFYDIAGDMNVHGAQSAEIERLPPTALPVGRPQRLDRFLPVPDGHDRYMGGAERVLSYPSAFHAPRRFPVFDAAEDVSRRPESLGAYPMDLSGKTSTSFSHLGLCQLTCVNFSTLKF